MRAAGAGGARGAGLTPVLPPPACPALLLRQAWDLLQHPCETCSGAPLRPSRPFALYLPCGCLPTLTEARLPFPVLIQATCPFPPPSLDKLSPRGPARRLLLCSSLRLPVLVTLLWATSVSDHSHQGLSPLKIGAGPNIRGSQGHPPSDVFSGGVNE